jgi:hypothetical protein
MAYHPRPNVNPTRSRPLEQPRRIDSESDRKRGWRRRRSGTERPFHVLDAASPPRADAPPLVPHEMRQRRRGPRAGGGARRLA